MSLNLPSTIALQYFVTAAKYESFRKAADELHVTQAAISKQIKNLESQLNVELFERTKQRIRLTESGRFYWFAARDVLDDLRKATLDIQQFETTQDYLHIATLPTLASRWLIPMLPKFYAEHPDILLHISTHSDGLSGLPVEFDMCISFDEDLLTNVTRFDLIPELSVVVASPALTNEQHSAEHIGAMDLLWFSPRKMLWQDWFAQFGHRAPIPKPHQIFESFQTLIHAVQAGLGVGLLPEFLIRDELASGKLVRLHDKPLQSEPIYFLGVPKAKSNLPNVLQFKHWIEKQI